MRCEWVVDQADVERVRVFVSQSESSAVVAERIRRNVERYLPEISPQHVWHVLVACLLTTMQRSGPQSPVSQFLSISPFPLRLEACTRSSDLIDFGRRTLKEFGGIRFTTKIPGQLKENLSLFCDDEWADLEGRLISLKEDSSLQDEREVAKHLADAIHGFGPKQSRNFLQILGLSRFVVPLDSRVTKWLNDFGFPVRLSSDMLFSHDYYEFVEDGLQVLCDAAGVFPCVLDAAIFQSFDEVEWTPEMAVW